MILNYKIFENSTKLLARSAVFEIILRNLSYIKMLYIQVLF